jgi:hypothetical protein
MVMISHRFWSTSPLLLCVLGISTVFLAPAITSGAFGDPSFQGKYNQTKSSLVPHRHLQFVHIPKTAGAFLEELAAKHKVTWSRCYFEKDASVKVPCPSNWKTTDTNLNFDEYRKALRPEIDRGWAPFWHIPPRYFRQNWTELVKGLRDIYREADLFCIVRNPYDRLISEWYYRTTVLNSPVFGGRNASNNVTLFNQFIGISLKVFQRGRIPSSPQDMVVRRNEYWTMDGHFIPQHHFVFDGNTQIINHVLRYENFTPEFNSLMKEYGLPMQFSNATAAVNAAKVSKKQLSVYNLSLSNLVMVNEIYRHDFESFGYEIVMRKTPIIT